jgi:hypothetical protein
MAHAPARANPYTDCCKLVNGKKQHLYNKKIDRSNHKELLQTVLGDKYEDAFFNNNFDWTQKENCCNVIAFTLYFIEPTQEISNKFLLSIDRSIKNISKILPDWVIRVYFGSSVFKYFGSSVFKYLEGTDPKDTDDQIPPDRRAFKAIYRNPQVEVYQFKDGRDELNIPTEHTRTTRFLSLIDRDVAFFFSHESDGCSNLLLHNLRAWSESPNMLFYLPEYIEVNQIPPLIDLPLFSSYSSWLYVFKSILRRYYFHNHHNIYDLLAGGFGTIIKLTGEFYTRTIAELNKSVDDFGKIQETYNKDMCAEQEAKPSPPSTFRSFIDKVEPYLIPPEIKGEERTQMIPNLRLGGDSRLIPIRDDDNDHEAYRKDHYEVPTTHTTIMSDYGGTPIYRSYNFRSFLYKLTTTPSFNASVKQNLIMGFDEMLLLDLFKRFISIKLVNETIDNRGNVRMTGYVGQINRIKQIIMANGDDKSCVALISITKDLIERIQTELLRGDFDAINELIDLLYELPKLGLEKILIPQTDKRIPLEPGFESITYSRWYNPHNYLYIYVLIDNILKYIKRSHHAINVKVRIINKDKFYIDFNLIALLNIPFSQILGPLYDLPIAHGIGTKSTKKQKPSYGGSKRHTITSLRTKRTNRRKKRSYRSKKKSYKKHNKKTYKYKK